MPRPVAIRIVTIASGHASAEDLVVDHSQAVERLGQTAADLIFDTTRPGTLDLTPDTATRTLGVEATALIFPSTHSQGSTTPSA